MKPSTDRGRRCTCQATARLAEAEVFRQFQYLTVPLVIVHVGPEALLSGPGPGEPPAAQHDVPAETRVDQPPAAQHGE